MVGFPRNRVAVRRYSVSAETLAINKFRFIEVSKVHRCRRGRVPLPALREAKRLPYEEIAMI